MSLAVINQKIPLEKNIDQNMFKTITDLYIHEINKTIIEQRVQHPKGTYFLGEYQFYIGANQGYLENGIIQGQEIFSANLHNPPRSDLLNTLGAFAVHRDRVLKACTISKLCETDTDDALEELWQFALEGKCHPNTIKAVHQGHIYLTVCRNIYNT